MILEVSCSNDIDQMYFTEEADMNSLNKIKHNFLIKLMSILGFGGMVGFCISSCDSDYN